VENELDERVYGTIQVKCEFQYAPDFFPRVFNADQSVSILELETISIGRTIGKVYFRVALWSKFADRFLTLVL